MGFVRKVLGPSSKYNQTLPYTYMAKVIVIEGMRDLDLQCYADTVCGLIDYLEEKGISAADVELYAVYRTQEIQLDTKYCVDENGLWLERPEICKSLQKHFRETLDEQYRGHVADAECSYDDRDRVAIGTY